MNEKARQLYQVMKDDLMYCRQKHLLPFTELECCFHICHMYWGALQQELAAYEFENHEKEIIFFKTIKPLFTAEITFYGLLCYAQLFEKSTGNLPELKQFWLREKMRLDRFINKHADFYRYYKNGSVWQDATWFIRKRSHATGHSNLTSHETNSRTATSHDHLISTLLALERYDAYVKEELGAGITL